MRHRHCGDTLPCLASTDTIASVRALEDAVKLTGERPMEGATPDSLLALHDAGYREVVARLGPGVVVDIGCGIGSETERLAGPDRLVIGADHSSETVRLASRTYATKPSSLDFVGLQDDARSSLAVSHSERGSSWPDRP